MFFVSFIRLHTGILHQTKISESVKTCHLYSTSTGVEMNRAKLSKYILRGVKGSPITTWKFQQNLNSTSLNVEYGLYPGNLVVLVSKPGPIWDVKAVKVLIGLITQITLHTKLVANSWRTIALRIYAKSCIKCAAMKYFANFYF